MKKVIYFFIISIFYSHLAWAATYSVDTVPNLYKQNEVVYVSDPDNIISLGDKSEINQVLANLEAQTGIEVAVVALGSVGQQDTRQFANQLFNHWKIGKAEHNNGLLILLVVDQREIVFETGYGLEGTLPDIICYRLQQQYMVPDLRNNNFSRGMLQGVLGVSEYLISADPAQLLNTSTASEQQTSLFFGINWMFFAQVLVVALALLIIMPRLWFNNDPKKLHFRSQVWAFLIGVFMLIFVPSFIIYLIISRFYLSYLREKATNCNKCFSYHLKKFSRADATAKLNEKETFCVKIKSIKYRVYECLDCQHIVKVAQKNARFRDCPKCKRFTAKRQARKVLKPATYSSTGTAQEEFLCLFCGETHYHKVTIPRKTRSSSSSSGSGSSRSSSGGSRGGGSSGGGGSRSRF